MARTMLERYMEKNYGIYDKFQHSLDKSYVLDGGRCHYCNQRLTTDPFERPVGTWTWRISTTMPGVS